LLPAGCLLSVHSSGRFEVHDEPRPWVSEPQGITIEYHRGRPLGEVVGMLVSPDGTFASRRIVIGTGSQLDVPEDSELWLQLNDSAARRRGNRGEVVINWAVDAEP
jgi:hypothetical protein